MSSTHQQATSAEANGGISLCPCNAATEDVQSVSGTDGKPVHEIPLERRLKLLGIPLICRLMALEMVLQNKARMWKDTVIDHDVSHIYLRIPHILGEGDAVPRYTISSDRIHIGNIKILLVCRQLYSEGIQVLYGGNSLVSYNFSQLKHRLPAVIGRQNMKFIQWVTLGLLMKHKRDDPIAYLGGFLEFLKEKLPNLSELTLTSQFGPRERPFVKNGINTRIGEGYRAMLNTSAWFTYRHPTLKRAIWLAKSGGLSPPQPSIFHSHDQFFPIDANDFGGTVADGWQTHGAVGDGDVGDERDHDATQNDLQSDHTGVEWAWTAGDIAEEADDEPSDQDLMVTVSYCRLAVKIIAEDRCFRRRSRSRIDLLLQISRTVARVGEIPLQ
jgi:hypothetical protein